MSLRDHDSACGTGLSLLFEKGFLAHHRLTSPVSLGAYSDYALIDVSIYVFPLPATGSGRRRLHLNSILTTNLCWDRGLFHVHVETREKESVDAGVPRGEATHRVEGTN